MDDPVIRDEYPLRRGEVLSSHDWFPFYGHRFLSSEFLGAAVMEGRRADVGTALILWSEAMRQDPAGTLPVSDVQLASLARFPDVEKWLAVKDNVLHGWVEVSIECDVIDTGAVRLGHPGMLQTITEDMAKRKRGRDGARVAAKIAVRKTRIKSKMQHMRIQDRIINDDRVLHALAEYFQHSDLYITEDNVRAAMISEIGYVGDVIEMKSKRKGGGE